ncbi:hypothetical protein BKA64DRAFT_240187 [Cadophora sp. MPI-SDFR-AT-0126]|nr:hypothetical protein BKA64DRAFT_240187 [Leotiomycetes sp. MPI-SDFR-AT-0126]
MFSRLQFEVRYITDLDSLCVLSLAATASQNQCVFLRDFVYKHLARKTFLGIQIPSIGWPIFCLEFHLPYRAWRPMKMTKRNNKEGSRGRARGRPHRRSEEVIPLGAGTSKAYIHEAQISVMLIGLDD